MISGKEREGGEEGRKGERGGGRERKRRRMIVTAVAAESRVVPSTRVRQDELIDVSRAVHEVRGTSKPSID